LNRIPQSLLEDIFANRCLPIIGSGFSRNGISPDGVIPDWKQVGHHFAEMLEGAWSDKVPLAPISVYCNEFYRPATIQILRSILHIDNVSPGEVHNAFAKLPFDTVITTNYDFLLENAYRNASRRYIVIADENQFSTAQMDFGNNDRTLIIKIHGDFDHPDKMVITEDDFDKFKEENPLMTTYLSSLMMVRTLLFIGYSLDDFNIRPLWYVVSSKLKKLQRQAFAFTNSNKRSKIFEMRGIKEINVGKKPNWIKMFMDLETQWSAKLRSRGV